MSPVGVISYNDGRSVTMDVEDVIGIEFGLPIDLGEGQWYRELIVRTSSGFVALQMLADSPEKFEVTGLP